GGEQRFESADIVGGFHRDADHRGRRHGALPQRFGSRSRESSVGPYHRSLDDPPLAPTAGGIPLDRRSVLADNPVTRSVIWAFLRPMRGDEEMETMRAAVMRDRKLVVAEVPMPQPGPGEVLVRTLACGSCGYDLPALKCADQFVATAKRAGTPRVMDLSRDVVMGHEFSAEIVAHGPQTTRAFKTGTRVCSRPVLMPATGPQSIGYSNDNP